MDALTLSEKNNKKKGMRVTLAFHIALILLALIPFMTAMEDTPDPMKNNKAIAVQFVDFSSASKQSKEGKKSTTPVIKETKTEKAEPKKTETKPTPAPPERTPRKPVLKTDKPNPPVKTAPKPPKVKPTPKPTPKPPTPKPVETKPEVVKETPAPKTPTKPAKTQGTDSKADKAEGSSAGQGKTGNGKSDAGEKEDMEGNDGDGDKGDDFSGDGIFGRKVIYRANVKSITSEEGKIVVNLCVNNAGRVIFAEADKDLSTIDSPSVLRKAVDLTTQYKFEKDYSAPKKQCGKLTYVFTIDN